MATVSASLGFTKNIGNFESVRAEFGHSDEVRDGEEVADAQKRVYDVVERELITRLQQVVEEVNDVNG